MRLCALTLVLLPILLLAEDWPGFEAGHRHHNAAARGPEPERVARLWQRDFQAVPTQAEARKSWGEVTVAPMNSYHGSRNLVLVDGHLAIIGPAPGVTLEPHGSRAWLSVLAAESGEIVNCIRVHKALGNFGVRGEFPANPRWNGFDTPMGLGVLYWDPATSICYIGTGGDGSGFFAYLPLANAEAYAGSGDQPGVPAFAALQDAHSGIQDVFGRPRAEAASHKRPHKREAPIASCWGPSLVYAEEDESGKTVANRAHEAAGLQSFDYANRSSFFEIDPAAPLIACTGSSHKSAEHWMLYHKGTGQLVLPGYPDVPQDPSHPGQKDPRPFNYYGGGLLVDGDRLYGIGHADGAADSKRGGLAIWSMRYLLQDRQANDGAPPELAAETAQIEGLWRWALPGQSADSYRESDGFYRNKAVMLADDALWAAWLADPEQGVELVRADVDGVQRWPLGIGVGLAGVDLWPHIAGTVIDGTQYIAYYAGTGHRRAKTKQGWGEELLPPAAAPSVAVFDATHGRLRFSQELPDLGIPANPFWGYDDRSQMLIAGRNLWIGWIDTQGDDLALRLRAYDLTAETAEPVDRRIALDLPTAGHGKSILSDLIAADGRLYALITLSHELEPERPHWQAQRIVALGAAATP